MRRRLVLGLLLALSLLTHGAFAQVESDPLDSEHGGGGGGGEEDWTLLPLMQAWMYTTEEKGGAFKGIAALHFLSLPSMQVLLQTAASSAVQDLTLEDSSSSSSSAQQQMKVKVGLCEPLRFASFRESPAPSPPPSCTLPVQHFMQCTHCPWDYAAIAAAASCLADFIPPKHQSKPSFADTLLHRQHYAPPPPAGDDGLDGSQADDQASMESDSEERVLAEEDPDPAEAQQPDSSLPPSLLPTPAPFSLRLEGHFNLDLTVPVVGHVSTCVWVAFKVTPYVESGKVYAPVELLSVNRSSAVGPGGSSWTSGPLSLVIEGAFQLLKGTLQRSIEHRVEQILGGVDFQAAFSKVVYQVRHSERDESSTGEADTNSEPDPLLSSSIDWTGLNAFFYASRPAQPASSQDPPSITAAPASYEVAGLVPLVAAFQGVNEALGALGENAYFHVTHYEQTSHIHSMVQCSKLAVFVQKALRNASLTPFESEFARARLTNVRVRCFSKYNRDDPRINFVFKASCQASYRAKIMGRMAPWINTDMEISAEVSISTFLELHFGDIRFYAPNSHIPENRAKAAFGGIISTAAHLLRHPLRDSLNFAARQFVTRQVVADAASDFLSLPPGYTLNLNRLHFNRLESSEYVSIHFDVDHPRSEIHAAVERQLAELAGSRGFEPAECVVEN